MRRHKAIAVAFAGVTLLAGARCAVPQARTSQVHASSDVMSSTPVIDSVRPDSVIVPYGGVVEVTLHGKGFVPGQPGQNTVHFDGTSLRQVPASTDGRRVVFVVPDVINRGGEAPPARLQSGNYPVSVETSSGMSNAVIIKVYR